MKMWGVLQSSEKLVGLKGFCTQVREISPVQRKCVFLLANVVISDDFAHLGATVVTPMRSWLARGENRRCWFHPYK